MKPRKRAIKRRVGDVVAVPLSPGRIGFGLVLPDALMAFFDGAADHEKPPDVADILKLPVAFRVWVMHAPIKSGEWPVIGTAEVPQHLLERPLFFKQDDISKRITVGPTAGPDERPPLPGELDRLECMAVWSACHIVDRLNDHLARRPNKWVESMRPRLP